MWRTITVAGSGVTGAALACVLAQSRLFEKVILVDMRNSPAYPGRLTVGTPSLLLTQRSVDFFKSIDIWKNIDPEDVATIKSLQVLDFYHSNRTFAKLSAAAVRKETLIYHLNQRLYTYPNVDVRFNTFVEKVESKKEGILVHATDIFHTGKSQIESAAVIGADGLDSPIRRNLKLTSKLRRFPHRILSCSLRGNAPLPHMTLKAMENGRMLFIPLLENDCSLYWTVPDSTAAQYEALPANEFLSLVNREIHRAALNSTEVEREDVAPVFEKITVRRRIEDRLMLRISGITQGKIMLVGSAAHEHLSLPGQGLNMQISAAIKLAQGLCREAEGKLEFGSTMKKYAKQTERWTQFAEWFEWHPTKMCNNSSISNMKRRVAGALFETFASESTRGSLFSHYTQGFQSCPPSSQWQWLGK